MKYSEQSFHFWEKNFCVQSRRSSQSAFSLGNHTNSIQTRFLSICFCIGGFSAEFLSSFALEPVVRQHVTAAVHGSVIHHVARLGTREIRRDKSLCLTEAQTIDSDDLSLGQPSRSFFYLSISLGCKQSFKIWATRWHCWYTKRQMLTWAAFYLRSSVQAEWDIWSQRHENAACCLNRHNA